MKDKNRKKILVINGPNLNMLGIREPDIYGRETYQSLCDKITRYCESVGAEAELYQSNHEGDLVDKIQSAYGVFDGIIINPAAYTHTSVALLDALKAVGIPAVEVHISDDVITRGFPSGKLRTKRVQKDDLRSWDRRIS